LKRSENNDAMDSRLATTYFDWHATAPVHPAAVAAVARVEAEAWGNPSSLHRHGVRAALELERARAQVAALLGVAEARVVWTSGATESAHAAAQAAAGWAPGTVALLGQGEHAAVVGAVEAAFGAGKVEPLALDGAGRVAGAAVAERLAAGGVGLVAVQAASSESGAHQPWRAVAALTRRMGVPLLVDATAWIGREDAAGLGEAELVFFAGHKFGAPRGMGVLVVPEDRSVGWFRGGGQQAGRRGGTENVAGAVALAAVLEAVASGRAEWAATQRRARDDFEAALRAAWPACQFLAAGADRLPNCSFAVMPWGEQERWVLRLDRLGYAVGTGSACATGKHASSPLAAAAGLSPEESRRLVRFTSGWATPAHAWAELAVAVIGAGEHLRD